MKDGFCLLVCWHRKLTGATVKTIVIFRLDKNMACSLIGTGGDGDCMMVLQVGRVGGRFDSRGRGAFHSLANRWRRHKGRSSVGCSRGRKRRCLLGHGQGRSIGVCRHCSFARSPALTTRGKAIADIVGKVLLRRHHELCRW
jgi:hypothetical protein